jgi:hypothetical protein
VFFDLLLLGSLLSLVLFSSFSLVREPVVNPMLPFLYAFLYLVIIQVFLYHLDFVTRCQKFYHSRFTQPASCVNACSDTLPNSTKTLMKSERDVWHYLETSDKVAIVKKG